MDRLFHRSILVILFVLGLLWSRVACASWHVDGDGCDPAARANSWTRAEKDRTRERVWIACKSVGGSDLYCRYWDAVIVRESWGGVASAVHTRGVDSDGVGEYGLGPMGLSVRWHGDKWPGEDEDPAFCTPEVSFAVGHALAHGAMRKFEIRNAVELQAVFGGGRGAIACWDTGAPAWFADVPGLRWILRVWPAGRECEVTPLRRHEQSICGRMGVDALGRQRCWLPLDEDDLGAPISADRRRTWAWDLASRW